MNITAFCIKRPITVGMFFLALLIIGVVSASKMPIDLFPQISYPAINISTSYTGAGPEEIEQLITIPVEQAVSTVNQVTSITSSSQEGSSRVTVNFDWGVNLDEATNDIRASLDRLRARLPDDADTPMIFKYDPSSSPVLTLGLSGSMDEATLRELADNDLSNELQKVDGVAQIQVRGGRSREIRVFLKQDRLQALGITADQVAAVLKNENVTQPAGHLAVGVGDFLLRTKGDFQSLDDIRNLVVTSRNDVPVFLRDIASVSEGLQAVTNLVRIDNKPGIVLSVQKRSGFNTVAVADGVYKAVEQLKEKHPDITLRIMNDDSIYIRRSVQSVVEAGLIGGILAGIILLFFFHNIRIAIIAGVAMPVSVLITLTLAYFNKMTLNTLSMGGLALGVGMLVDNAVVVIDNIIRHHQRDGVDLATAAVKGTSEMGPAISASTITHICVFFPLLYITGRSGIMYKELSYMVIFSILCSLLVATTLIPMLCAKFLKARDTEDEVQNGLKGGLIRLQNGWEEAYENLLAWCLNHKFLVISVCTAFFLLTLLIYPLIGTELIQNTDEGVISVNLQLPVGTRLEETDANAKKIEAAIQKSVPELVHLEATIGQRGTNSANLTVRLLAKTDRKRTTQEVVDDLQGKLQIPGARIRVNASNSMRMFYGGSQFPIDVDVRGQDSELTNEIAIKIMDAISVIPGINSVNMSRSEAQPQLVLQINRKRAADLGVSAAQIATAIQTSIQGKTATIYRQNGEETDVRVSLQETDRQSWQDLQKIMITTGDGQTVPISSMVDIIQSNSPVSIDRTDQQRNISVTAGLQNRDLASAMKDIRKAVSRISLPPGVGIYYGGDYEEQQKSSSEMLLTVILAFVLVYMVMAAQFESFFDPFIITLSIPFALGGVLLILLLTDTNFNTQVYLGLIMLGGIVVNNAIVLISYIRILIERGTDLTQAVLIGARSRLRPILITTATTILGLLPLALGIGEGSETQYPLARTVIGGLLFSTVLTLILIPIIFTTLEGLLQKGFRRKKMAPVSGTLLIILFSGLILTVSHPARAAEVKKVTVKDAIQLALQNNETGKIIAQKRETAASVYRQAMGEKAINLYTEADSSFSSKEKSASLAVTAEKSIPVANLTGLKSLADQVTESNQKVSLLSADLDEENFIYQVITLYQKELTTRRDLQLAEESYDRSRKFYNEVMTRSKLGLTTVSDEMGAQSQTLNDEVNVKRCQQLYRLAQLKLRQILGLDPAAELELVPLPEGQTEYSLPALQQTAQVNRIALKQAQENAARAAILLKIAQLSNKLGVTLGWDFQRDNFEAGVSLTNINSKTQDSDEWRLAGDASVYPIKWKDPAGTATNNGDWGALNLTFKWTFFDGNVRREKIKQAELLTQQLDETLRQSQKDISYDVEDAYYNYLNQVDRTRSAELQVNYNKVYLDAAQSKLRVGMATVKDVLDAQIVLHQSESDYERAKNDLYLAKINLLKATGQLTADTINP